MLRPRTCSAQNGVETSPSNVPRCGSTGPDTNTVTMTERASFADRSLTLVLYALGAGALLFGLYARFRGLGGASMAPDEYYIARSVDNVLAFGIPAFECGGLYTRGLVLQYLSAVLRSAGMAAELSTRSIAAVSSVLALPAVYILGRRIHGRAVAVAALAVLAVSVWEVEMARFGRMYAPFQALFLWYLVFFVRYTVDRDQRALWGMLAFTILGALTWEGSVFLALASLLAPFLTNPSGRFSRRDVWYLVTSAALLVLVYVFVTTDFRLSGTGEEFPAGFDVEAAAAPRGGELLPLWSTLSHHPRWIALALGVVALAAWSLRWIWSLRDRWTVALGLLAALVLALAHQFAAFVGVLVVLLVIEAIRWPELFGRASRPFWIAVAASAIFWVAFGVSTSEWHAQVQTTWLGTNKLVLLLYQFARLPDLLLQVARPWSGAAPFFAGLLAALVGLALLQLIVRDRGVSVTRALMLVLISMLLVVGVSNPPRQETRYIFFLYPVAVLLAITALVRVTRWLGERRNWGAAATSAGALASLALYAVTEDFRPRHLANIDSAEVNLREGLSSRMEAHLVARTDLRGAAQWLVAHASQGQDLLVNAVPGVDYYFRPFNFTYIDESEQRFAAYACGGGSMERWGNLPLLYTLDDLGERMSASRRTFMVVSSRHTDRLTTELASKNPRVVWSAPDGEIDILMFTSGASEPSAPRQASPGANEGHLLAPAKPTSAQSLATKASERDNRGKSLSNG